MDQYTDVAHLLLSLLFKDCIKDAFKDNIYCGRGSRLRNLDILVLKSTISGTSKLQWTPFCPSSLHGLRIWSQTLARKVSEWELQSFFSRTKECICPFFLTHISQSNLDPSYSKRRHISNSLILKN